MGLSLRDVLSGVTSIYGAPVKMWDFRNGMPGDINYSCASANRSYHDANGIVQYAGANVARIQRDALLGSVLGYLSERQMTNLLPNSAVDGNWSLAGATFDSSNPISAPDGASNVSPLYASSLAENHRVIRAFSGGPAGNQKFCWSVRAKLPNASDVARIYMRARSGSNGGCGGSYTIASGLISASQIIIPFGYVPPAQPLLSDMGVIRASSGWQTIFGAGAISGDSTPVSQVDFGITPTTSEQGAGTTNSKLALAQAQLIANPYPLSYFPTAGSAATRAADVTSRGVNDFLSGGIGSGVLAARTARGGGQLQVLLSIDDGTSANRISIRRETDRSIHIVVVAGGVTQADISLGVVADYTDMRLAFSVSSAGVVASLNSGASVLSGAITIPSVTTLHWGHDYGAANHWDGTISYHAHWTDVLPAFVLEGVRG